MISSAPGYSTSWNQSTQQWVQGAYWNPATFSSGWSLPISSSAFVDGGQYRLNTKGDGPAGYEVTTIPTVAFTIDRTPPTGSITTPPNSGQYQYLASFSGNANDNAPGIISGVQLQIVNPAGNSYFDGNAWQLNNPNTWIPVSANGGSFNSNNVPWNYPIAFTTACWNTQGTYSALIKVTDGAGNTYTTANTQFIIDRTPP